MIADTDVLSRLSYLEIDGLKLPVLERRAGFRGEHARHKFEFRNGELVQALGSLNFSFTYTIPFRQGIAKGPYRDLFTKSLPRFIVICRKAMGEEVDLFDPVHGFFRVLCLSLEESTDNNKRDGADIQVEFLHSPVDTSGDAPESPLSFLSGAKSEAGALDAATGPIFRSAQVAPTRPLVNPISAISGLIKQVALKGDQIQAKIADFSSRISEMEDAIADLEEPDLAPTIRSLRNLRDSSEKTKKRIQDPTGSLRSFTVSASMTVGELAKSLGVDIPELVSANPTLAKTAPAVPVGLVVKYKASS